MEILTTVSFLNFLSDSSAGSFAPERLHSGDGAAVTQVVELVPFVVGGVRIAGEKVSWWSSASLPLSSSSCCSSSSSSSSSSRSGRRRPLATLGLPRSARSRETKSSSFSSSRNVRDALEVFPRGLCRRTRVDGTHSFFSRKHLANLSQDPLHWKTSTGRIAHSPRHCAKEKNGAKDERHVFTCLSQPTPPWR